VNDLVAGGIPKGSTKNDKDRFFYLVKFFAWDDPYLFKYCSDQVFRESIPDNEVMGALSFCYDQACGCILVVGRLNPKFLSVVSISLLYLGMLLSIVKVFLGANSWVQ